MIKRISIFFGVIVIILGLAEMGQGQAKVSASVQTEKEKLADEQLYPIEVEGKYGFINSKGETVIQPIYDSSGYAYPGQPGSPVFVEDRAKLEQIYFSVTGDKLFECPLNTCGVLYDGLALYTSKFQNSDGISVIKYGYINSQGDVVIPPIYHKAFNFVEGLARVNQGKATGYINTKGELVIPYRFSATSDFSEGLAVVKYTVSGKYGYIDTSGKLIVSTRFDYAEAFSEGVAAVYVNGKYGYIDKTGKYLLPPQYSLARPFSDGLAFVERNGVTFYINKKGEKVIHNIKVGEKFSGGLAPASTGRKYGYINTSGTFVIKQQFEWANFFSGDLAQVYLYNSDSSDDLYAYINRNGEIVWQKQ
ncbi:hypothetical protein J2T13_000367 [Paenibacillus sp. DS2015]|uniref:WG repeat-containing protein n=1 Tax=Paenibacillus sp. DS2015 TaxID=3373917 RepID=UPI003D1E4A66